MQFYYIIKALRHADSARLRALTDGFQTMHFFYSLEDYLVSMSQYITFYLYYKCLTLTLWVLRLILNVVLNFINMSHMIYRHNERASTQDFV